MKNILQYVLVIMLFVATTGVTLNKHYCMGRLKSVTVFHKAQSCMEKFGRECPKHCCDDEQEEYRVQDLSKVNHNYDFNPELDLIAITNFSVIVEELIASAEKPSEYLNYKPPLIDQNIPVQVQSFLL